MMENGHISTNTRSQGEAKSSIYHRVLEHMNDDHVSSIVDYVRYYGRLDCAVKNVEMTDISLSSMTVQYDIKKRETITIPFHPPLSHGGQFRVRLVKMANDAIVSRIPIPAVPNVALSATLVVLLSLLGVSAFCTDETRASFPAPFRSTVAVGHALANLLFFHSQQFKQIAFWLAILVHSLEGAYAAMKIRCITKTGLLFRTRSLFWIVQTTVVGFPSLLLFLERLERLQEKKNM